MEPIALINFKGTTMLDHSETYTLYIEFKLNIYKQNVERMHIGENQLCAPGNDEDFETFLSEISDEQFEDIWKHRFLYERDVRVGGKAQIWTEATRRYSLFKKEPIKLKIPRAVLLDIGKMKESIRDILTHGSKWPNFLY